MLGSQVAGVEVNLVPQVVLPFTYAAGSVFTARIQAFGTGPTTVRAKVWPAGAAEPSAWQLSVTDSAPALQTAGGIGLLHYLSAASTVAPSTITSDDLTARPVTS